jgi:hypothetical protein
MLAASTAATAADCVRIDDDALRLACYDKDAGRPPARTLPVATTPREPQKVPAAVPPPAAASSAEEEPSWLMSNLKIRDALEGSKKGASLTATREHGTTIYSLKAAALLDLGNRFLPEVAAMNGWSWNLGAQATKDTSQKKPVDGRVFKFGSTGDLFGGSPLVLLSSIDAESVADHIAKTRDVGLRYAGMVVLPDSQILQGGTPYSRVRSGHYILPVVGLHLDRHREDGASSRMYGGHVGVGLSYFPGGPLWRLHLFGDAVRARDFHSNASTGKRVSTYYDAGVEYAFIDPLAPTQSGVIPTLSLKRTLGGNFLTGEAETAKTVLTLTLRLN